MDDLRAQAAESWQHIAVEAIEEALDLATPSRIIDVVEANTLLTEALAGDEARSWLWARLRPEAPQVLRADEPPASAEEAVAIAVTGLRAGDDCSGIEVEDLFRLPPLPNWCFQRDPQVILGDGIIFSAMATSARWREGLLTRCIFRFHPELAGTSSILDPLREAREAGQFFGPHRPRLEGGDVLVMSPEVAAIGVSERTNMVAVELLAEALAKQDGGPRWLEVVHVPARRAYMHLDTVFTPVDRDAALVCYDDVRISRRSELTLRTRPGAPLRRDRLSHRGRRWSAIVTAGPCG